MILLVLIDVVINNLGSAVGQLNLNDIYNNNEDDDNKNHNNKSIDTNYDSDD